MIPLAEKILVVDDEQKIRDIIRIYLERDGFLVFEAANGQEALEQFGRIEPDLVILDLMLPILSGERVAAAIREKWATPVIMLTAKTAEEDRIAGLEGGADDYVTKPFSPKELVARVNAVLRRNWRVGQAELQSADGAVVVNQAKHEIAVHGQRVALTPTEYKLLILFLSNPGEVFSRGQLAEKALGWEYTGYEETIYVHIKNLRKKLEAHSPTPYINTVYGIGYRWLE